MDKEFVSFIGPHQHVQQLKKSLIYLDPTPTFTSSLKDGKVVISITSHYYESNRETLQEIMDKYRYQKINEE